MLVVIPAARQTNAERFLENALPPLNRAAKRTHYRTLRLARKKDARLEALKESRKA